MPVSKQILSNLINRKKLMILGEIEERKVQFDQMIEHIDSENDLQALKVSWLGRKGILKRLMNSLKSQPSDTKTSIAQALNEFKKHIEDRVADSSKQIQKNELERKIKNDWLDMSLPGFNDSIGSTHPLSRVEKRCIEILGLLGFEVENGPEVEDAFHNFDALNIPEDHPARDMQDTYWTEGGLLLRSHTSTVQIRVLAKETTVPIRIIAPGKVYRNEAVDATHLANFHQFEGLWVDKGVTFDHLKGTLDFVVRHIFGSDWDIRYKPKFYPYTEPSIGVDVRRKGTNDSWITVLGGGMVHPNVFKNTGHDPQEVSGFAFGLGMSRIVTMVYGVTDMKSLYEGDLRVHSQLIQPNQL